MVAAQGPAASPPRRATRPVLSSSPTGAARPSYIRPLPFDPPRARSAAWCSRGILPRLCRPKSLYAQRIPRATDRFAERVLVPSSGAGCPGYIEPTWREIRGGITSAYRFAVPRFVAPPPRSLALKLPRRL